MKTAKWLLIRLDRIGDLVLTLPSDSVLSSPSGGTVRGETTGETPLEAPSDAPSEVTWWIPPGLSFITHNSSPRRKSREVARKFDRRVFLSLLRELRETQFSGAIVYHGPWWISALLWLARVPIRGGVKSQWHSFFFLNRAIRQKRSQAECSELEYGYRLTEAVLGRPEGSTERTSLKLGAGGEHDRKKFLSRHGLQAYRFAVLHPGMGGSALNWPIENYAELAKSLAHLNTVVITGTASDEPYLAPLRKLLNGVGNIYWTEGKLNSTELLMILKSAKCTVAPSTGVLHLAASTGQPTVGIYSPVLVQHPRRWGPQGPRAEVLLPKVGCPATLQCLGPSCPHFDCMKLIAVADVLAKVQSLNITTQL